MNTVLGVLGVIGKALLVLLLILLVLIAVVLTVPVRIRFTFDQGEIEAGVRYGPLRIPLYPRPEAVDKPKKKAKKDEKKPKGGEGEEKKKKKKFTINAQQILHTLESLPPVVGRLLRRLGRGVSIAPLKVHLLVAGPDPADTAILYGKLQAALAAGLPVLHRYARIRDQDIQLFLDFQSEEIDVIADVGFAMRGWTFLWALLCAGGSSLKWLLGFRKMASPPKAGEGDKSSGETDTPQEPEKDTAVKQTAGKQNQIPIGQ